MKEKSIINILQISRHESALLRQAGGENRIHAVLIEGPAGGHPTGGPPHSRIHHRWVCALGRQKYELLFMLSCAGMLATAGTRAWLLAHILPPPRFRSRGKPSQPVCVPSLLALIRNDVKQTQNPGGDYVAAKMAANG